MIDEVVEVDYEKLAEHLKKISKLEGSMIWSDEAKVTYNEWFYPYRESIVDDKTGTHDRMNDHVIKIATCISLARKLDMVLEEEDIADAIVACSSLSNTARQVAGMQSTGSAITALMKPFLMIMFSAEGYSMTRKKVLQKGFGEFDSNELDRVVETLNQMGFVVQLTGGKEVKYQITKLCVEWWEKNVRKN
jgi:hypothetical protein